MLQKTDLEKLAVVDRDRLEAVLAIINERKIKFPNATISKELNKDKSEVSSYLNAKKPMSTNFYETFMKLYGKNESLINEEATPAHYTGRHTEDILRDVARSSVVVGEANKIMAISHDKLIDTNSELVSVIKLAYGQSNSATVKESQRLAQEELQNCMVLIAKMLVKERLIATDEEALLKIGKCVYEDQVASTIFDKKNSAHKRSKQDMA